MYRVFESKFRLEEKLTAKTMQLRQSFQEELLDRKLITPQAEPQVFEKVFGPAKWPKRAEGCKTLRNSLFSPL